jgi:hypothetical protein
MKLHLAGPFGNCYIDVQQGNFFHVNGRKILGQELAQSTKTPRA